MHLYFHVPFCARRCSYCDFAITVRRDVPSEAYVDAVLAEWRMWQTEPVWELSPQIETIFFGGGTPSHIVPDAIGQLLQQIAADRRITPGAEVTLEANPDDVTPAAARAWRAAGVNRVSLGVQSFDPQVLRWMHRTHISEQVPVAVESLRNAGFTDLSLDLIFGLPCDLARDWDRDLDRALALSPDHLSLYGLTVEPHTALGHWSDRGEVTPVDERLYAAEFLAAHDLLVLRGYDHYEVSNFGRPGHRARHNSAYWTRAPFIGLGPSAHSGLGPERRWNLRDWSAYQRAMRAGSWPVAGRELLDSSDVGLEELYLGLRTAEGVPSTRVRAESIREWEREGWAVRSGDRVRLTPEGWLRLDALVSAVRV